MAKLDMTKWMGAVDGARRLSELTIPGSHDTCTASFHKAVTKAYVRTQSRSLREQLDRGTRFIDIRCKHVKDGFAIVHGKHYLNKYFGSGVLKVCLDFLEEHPTETIIMSIKEQKHGSSESFVDKFNWYVAHTKSQARWYFGDTVPTLDEARGKIVLLRRFEMKRDPKGIDVTAWKDKATFTIKNDKVDIKIQDQYEKLLPSSKWGPVRNLLDEAESGPAQRLYVNFCSATLVPLYTPRAFAKHINPKVTSYIGDHPPRRLGIVVMDFVSDELNRRLVETNLEAGAAPAVLRAA